MNELISGFKGCAHQAGEICRIANGVLVRRFGLGDFLENKLSETDSEMMTFAEVKQILGLDEVLKLAIDSKKSEDDAMHGFFSTCRLDSTLTQLLRKCQNAGPHGFAYKFIPAP